MKCPSTAYMLIFMYAVVIAVAVGLMGYARHKGVNLSALGIGVDFLQVVSVFTSFGFKWPIQLTKLFDAASATSFNEQLMAPECSIGAWGFELKWYIMQSVPLVFILGLVILAVIDKARGCFRPVPSMSTTPHLQKLLGRDKFKSFQDSYCGLCILALYFLYLMVVKGALSVFDCSKNKDGAYILDADPSIRCDEPGGVQVSMKPAAVLSLIGYTIGLPTAFLCILVRFRREIQEDQRLRVANRGGSEATNANFHIRRRFQELYSLFRPELYWWRLVLTLRKFCTVGVALMFSSTPLFQACVSVGIIFVSYALHVHYQPFLDPEPPSAIDDSTGRSLVAQGVQLIYAYKYNSLETLYLITSLFILLAGMAFQSGVTTVGSGPHVVLTWLVAVVLVSCICLFLGVLAVEVWRSIQFAHRVHLVVRKATATATLGKPEGPDPWAQAASTLQVAPAQGSDNVDVALAWVDNPLRRASREEPEAPQAVPVAAGPAAQG